MDSVEMAFRLGVDSAARPLARDLKILDVCAGCGVLGFEFHHFEKRVEHIDFVEIQPEYITHFEQNRSSVPACDTRFCFVLMNYDELRCDEYRGKYDLVLCNPPYFRKGHGTLGPSEFKNRCRFFLDSPFENLLKTIAHVLAPNGDAYLILRNLNEHRMNAVSEISRVLGTGFVVTELEAVRTARFVNIHKIACAEF